MVTAVDPLDVRVGVVHAQIVEPRLGDEVGDLAVAVEAQREAAGEVALCFLHLVVADRLVADLLHLPRARAMASTTEAFLVCMTISNGPGDLRGGEEAADRIGQAGLGADVVHQARREAAAAEHVVHHRHRLVVGVAARDAEIAHDDGGLGDRTIDADLTRRRLGQRRVDERRHAGRRARRRATRARRSRASPAERSPTTTTAARGGPVVAA